MFRIKRTKAGLVHYATSIAKQGNVTGWSREKEVAVNLPEAEAGKVQVFYATLDSEQKKHIGEIDRDPVSAADIQAALEKQQEESAGKDQMLNTMMDAVADLRKRVTALEDRATAPSTIHPTIATAPMAEKRDRAAK